MLVEDDPANADIVAQINELLETRVRPAVAGDGGANVRLVDAETLLTKRTFTPLGPGAFSVSGDDCTLTTYDFFNRELYKLHKVLMMVSRKLSYDTSNPHYFAANEERNKYAPPSFVEQLSVQPRRS